METYAGAIDVPWITGLLVIDFWTSKWFTVDRFRSQLGVRPL
jgi:hypothetical protein